jgi:hypothetical protein
MADLRRERFDTSWLQPAGHSYRGFALYWAKRLTSALSRIRATVVLRMLKRGSYIRIIYESMKIPRLLHNFDGVMSVLQELLCLAHTGHVCAIIQWLRAD